MDPESDACMPCLPSPYKGPAIVMMVGASFGLLGAIPVSITMALGIRTSATIIGMGFVCFGILLILPGFCWCIVVHHKKYSPWRRRNRLEKTTKGQEETPALGENNQSHYGMIVNDIRAMRPSVSDKDRVCADNDEVCS